MIVGRRVNLDSERVVKFYPSFPPRRGEFVLVDGVRCRVTGGRVRWDGNQWQLRSLRVKEARHDQHDHH